MRIMIWSPSFVAVIVAGCSMSHGTGADAGLASPSDAAPVDASRWPRARDAGGDAAAPRSEDAGAASDSGAPLADGVGCGAAACVVGSEACRATCLAEGAPASICISAPEGWEIGECPSGEESFPIVVARCDGPEDCGEAACVVLSGSVGNYPQCGCHEGPDPGCVQRWSEPLCHALEDCPSWATRCAPSELLAGFYTTCQADP